jgi:hypothetical protein
VALAAALSNSSAVPPFLRWPREVSEDSIVYDFSLSWDQKPSDYPVTVSQLDQSSLVITTADPVAFFTCTVKTPLLKLDDLRALMVAPKAKQ